MDRKDRLKATDFHPEVLRLFDGFVHGTKTRREFLDGAAKFAVGGFTAAAMLEALTPNFAWAQQVKPDDARIRTENVEYDSPNGHGKMRGLLAKPAKMSGKLPGVLVIHENRGLNPYIEDVTRRLALLNFVAFAPDALAPLGGYPGDEDKGRDMFAKQDAKKRIEDLAQGAAVMKARPEFSGKWGTVGFCFGGGIVNLFATRFVDMAAGVAYYGVQAPAAKEYQVCFNCHADSTNKVQSSTYAAFGRTASRYPQGTMPAGYPAPPPMPADQYNLLERAVWADTRHLRVT